MKYWLTLMRAIWATFLGLALVIQPGTTRPMFVNFLGIFWIMTGIAALLARNREDVRFGFVHLVAGIVGIVAGVIVVLRWVVASAVESLFKSDRTLGIVALSLGIVIILTGVLHATTGIDSWRRSHKIVGSYFILGIFEIILGGCVVISPQQYGPVLYWTATAWAIAGGIALFVEAVRLRAARKVAG